ncbi:AAA family ATPase [Pseudonocardia xinjiangensis]|uniref:Helix-turn-helix transcriptional regulator n=1 Tax=Pseudonocardia xinjiangensis TaxID=75289 RepID=A0ABX1RGP6_9PSEU|nr:AAA family ATPase [Pseudonocardia xinjiangensis]NMH79547.1 helix-turn-helix transcriptional regulator [Pseudonocardia xinjiangensis]
MQTVAPLRREPDLIGRTAERSRLARAVQEARTGPARLLVLGETGIGRSSLLATAVDDARQQGFRVLAGSGTSLPGCALLRRLVTPLMSVADRLPDSLRTPLHGLVSGTDDAAVRDPGTLHGAVSSLVREAARDRPLALVIDDVQSAGQGSLDLLAFLGHRLTSEHILLLFAARGLLPPEQLDTDLPVHHVGPLSVTEATVLLARQPSPPRGWIRGEILRHAGGNPRAVIELAHSAAGGDHRPRQGFGLTVPARIRRAHTARIEELPAKTRRVLLVAAAAEDRGDLQAVLSAAGADLADCGPAEDAALITIVGHRICFRDPTVRLACYSDASEHDRRQAHRALAAFPSHDAGRRAWHLANAAEEPGEDVALLLETAAAVACRQGRHVEAAGALERAADCTSDAGRSARRCARAALLAARGGHHAWCRQLWERVRDLTGDPALLGVATAAAGQHLPLHEPASASVLPIGRLLDSGLQDRGVAMALASAAGMAALVTGDAAMRAALAGIVERAESLPVRTALGDELCPGPADAAVAASVRSIGDPGGWQRTQDADPGLHEPQSGRAELIRLLSVGTASWMADGPTVASGYLRRAVQLLREDNAVGAHPFAFVMLLDALADCGLWREAAAVQAEATDVAAAGGLPVLGRAVAAQGIALQVLRGDVAAAQQALATLDPWSNRAEDDNPMVRCLVHRAAGRVHAAAGDHALACRHYLAMFGPDGEPEHFAWSYRAVAELARSAAKANRHGPALRVLHRVRRSAGSAPSAHRAVLIDRAAALLAVDDEHAVESALHAAATGHTGGERPHDQAVAMVDYADWLRARRRFVDARPLLRAAHDTFARIGATHDAGIARELLRATGVSLRGTVEGFALLTPQQQFIAKLAAQGLSNRAIADRLVLSPRTVGSHLYQIYPKLGVVSRRQLPDVISE